MREHVFGEIDKNKDRVISFDEFIAATEQKEFNQNDEWKVQWLLRLSFDSFQLKPVSISARLSRTSPSSTNRNSRSSLAIM